MSPTRQVSLGFAIGLIFELGVVVLSYRTAIKLRDGNRVVAHADEAIANLEGTVGALNNLEHSRMAWVMAGTAMHNLRERRSHEPACGVCHGPHTHPVEAEHFRDTHLEMIANLNQHIRKLKALIVSEPTQRENLRRLEALVENKAAVAREEISTADKVPFSALQSVLLERDANLTGDIQSIIAEMKQAQSKLLAEELRKITATARSEIFGVSLLGFLTICTAVVAYIVIQSAFVRRKALEEQLRQAAKMEAIGRLAGGVAHDFNNLLMPILGGAEMLRSELGQGHPAMEYVEGIKKAGETAASVTRQLLAFSRKQTVHSQKLNLNAVATNMSNLLQRLAGEQYQFETLLEPALGWVEVDPSKTEQVIMNLVLNARDAMPGGGIIAIETANVNLYGEKKDWCGSPLKGAYVVLAVSDDGVGMDESTCARVFEPFFTTKERGKGTGLGLATVYGIIAQSNGRVRVQSAVGKGTTFEVYLPRVEPPADSVQQVQSSAPGTPGMQATILLVEDDEAICRMLGTRLAGRGYRVLQARDGAEGLLAAQSCLQGIDLLITDVMMPELNGLELQKKLAVLHPGLRTIFMSGYTAETIDVATVLSENTLYLLKPFTSEELLTEVGQLLGHADRTTRFV